MTGSARAACARIFASLVATATCCALACNARSGNARGEATGDGNAASHRDATLSALHSAEYSRIPAAVSDEALADHDPAIRRAAARALARIDDAASIERLVKALADEDDEVVAWAAYGLGSACPVGDVKTVRVLVARLASLEAAPEPQHSAPFSARDAIFDALARCGSAPAEATLRAWLRGPEDARSAAALALARLASRQHRLDDASIVALLDAAGGSPQVHGALAAFGQLDAVSGIIAKRLVEVAARSIRDAGRERTFAISALSSAGEEGVELLSAVLANEQLPTPTRTRAAVTLGRIGKAAVPALAAAVGALAPGNGGADGHWLDAHFAPLLATLTALDPEATGKATDAVIRVAELAIANGSPPHVVRRMVALRCAAGSLLAGSATLSARLVHCDPDPNGRIGALATVRVLDRGKLAGARRKVWAEYARALVPGVRRAALSLLPRHLEAVPVIDELVSALSAKEPGVVSQAARALADAPRLASAHAVPESPSAAEAEAAEPSRAIVDALAKAMDAQRPPDQIETRVALANAAAGVSALSLKSRLEGYCASNNATVRRGAESSLRALGANVTCTAPKAAPVAPPPLATKPVTLTFVTDAGRFAVTLNPSFSPAAVARVTTLAKRGFYDSLPILRVSPAYVVQLGDSTGDGSGGSGEAPLPSEGTPVPFGAFAVGLALGGKDTGSSQVFVTEAEEPAIFGDYPLLGSADPEWAQVAEGDIISRVEVHD